MQPYVIEVYSSYNDTDDEDQSCNYLIFAKDIKHAVQKALKKSFREGMIGDLDNREIVEFDCGEMNEEAAAKLVAECVTLCFSLEQHCGAADLHEPEEDGVWVQFEAFSPADIGFWERLDDSDGDLDDLLAWPEKSQKAAAALLEAMQQVQASGTEFNHDDAAEFMAALEAIAVRRALPKSAREKAATSRRV